ncbi:MAG: PIN domain-containing protein [Bacteroidota bacterium]
MEDKRVFIDTNVIVYADSNDPTFGQIAKEKLLYYLKEGFELWINRQVIREYLVITSKKMLTNKSYDSKRLVARTAQFDLQFMVADDTKLVTDQLLRLVDKYQIKGKPIHDASIIATMLINGIDRLLTNNVSDFKRYDEDLIVVPLVGMAT